MVHGGALIPNSHRAIQRAPNNAQKPAENAVSCITKEKGPEFWESKYTEK